MKLIPPVLGDENEGVYQEDRHGFTPNPTSLASMHHSGTTIGSDAGFVHLPPGSEPPNMQHIPPDPPPAVFMSGGLANASTLSRAAAVRVCLLNIADEEKLRFQRKYLIFLHIRFLNTNAINVIAVVLNLSIPFGRHGRVLHGLRGINKQNPNPTLRYLSSPSQKKKDERTVPCTEGSCAHGLKRMTSKLFI